MAILKNVEIHYIKCDPKKPNAQFNKLNPTWEVQCRTIDPAVRDEWKALGLKPVLLTKADPDADPDLGDQAPRLPILDANGNKIFKIQLKKGSKKKDGVPADPVKVVRGNLDELDPNTVGNGSIANIRIFQWEGKNAKTGLPETKSMLMSLQVIKHVVYVPKASEDFEMVESETVMPDDDNDGDVPTPASNAAKPATQQAAKPAAVPAGAASRSQDDF